MGGYPRVQHVCVYRNVIEVSATILQRYKALSLKIKYGEKTILCIRDCGSNLYVGMRVVEMF